MLSAQLGNTVRASGMEPAALVAVLAAATSKRIAAGQPGPETQQPYAGPSPARRRHEAPAACRTICLFFVPKPLPGLT